MNKGFIFLTALFLFISLVSGLCNTNQIDINTASLEELDELYGIGPVKAQAIIDTRPFDSVNDLINVYGIGDSTLDKIIDQGLACVSDEPLQEESEDEEKNTEDEEKTENKVNEEEEIAEEEETDDKNGRKTSINLLQGDTIINENASNSDNYSVEKEKINLVDLKPDTKDIKTDEDKEELNRNNYTIYWLITFFVLIIFLFVLRKYNQLKKNEFR